MYTEVSEEAEELIKESVKRLNGGQISLGHIDRQLVNL